MVLLIGYIFYLLSRKDKEIGFQDFLIDSVFHVKKAPKKEISTPDAIGLVVDTPIVKSVPVTSAPQNDDPLASYTPPAPVVVTTSEPVSINTEVRNPPIVKDPLAETTPPTATPLPDESQSSIPAWLQMPKTEITVTPEEEVGKITVTPSTE